MNPAATEIHEQHLISGAISHPHMIRSADLEPEDFSQVHSRMIWRALQRIARAGRGTSMAEVALLATPDTDLRPRVRAYLNDCIDFACSPSDLLGYADNVRAASVHRATLSFSERIEQLVRDGLAGEELAAAAGRELTALSHRGKRCQQATLTELLEQAHNRIFHRDEDTGYVRIPTGLSDLDRIIGGWPCAQVSVVGAQSGAGKSSLLVQVAMHASSLGFPAHVVSVEDLQTMTSGRALAGLSGIDSIRLEDGLDLTERERSRLLELQPRYADKEYGHTLVSNAKGKTAEQIIGIVRSSQRRHGTAIVFVDYLQRIAMPAGVRKYDALTEAMDLFDRASNEDGLPWVVGSQVRRGEDQIPTINDFRDSGAIEEVSKLALALYRPGQHRQNREDNEMIIRVLKTSGGEVGDARFEWNGRVYRICNNPPAPVYQ